MEFPKNIYDDGDAEELTAALPLGNPAEPVPFKEDCTYRIFWSDCGDLYTDLSYYVVRLVRHHFAHEKDVEAIAAFRKVCTRRAFLDQAVSRWGGLRIEEGQGEEVDQLAHTTLTIWAESSLAYAFLDTHLVDGLTCEVLRSDFEFLRSYYLSAQQ